MIMRKSNKNESLELVYGRNGSRITGRGASIDLGRISLEEAQKRCWLWGASMVVRDEDAAACDAVARVSERPAARVNTTALPLIAGA